MDTKNIISSLAFILFIVACTNEKELITPSNESQKEKRVSSTSLNKITLQDVQKVAKAFKMVTRGDSDPDIDFIIDKENDTLFYVINNPKGGWKMYASDKRVPAVVAESPSGKYSHQEAMMVMGGLINDMAADMKVVKQAKDEYLSFSAEEISIHQDFWDAVCNPNAFLKKNTKETRVEIIDPPLHYWELIGTDTSVEVYDSLDHLIQTKWSQGNSGYNNINYYCPLKSDNSSNKAPAGCVAISAAQMLYFLHYKLGVPAAMVDSASCVGDINNYNMQQWGNSQTVWDIMDTLDFINAAPFVAKIGNLVNMQYGNEGSSASTSDLVSNVFNYYGIDCSYQPYNDYIVRNSLSNGMPVIARSGMNEVVETSNTSIGAHSFIIDGYVRSRTKTTYVYTWHGINPPFPGIILPNEFIPFVPDSIRYEYSEPYITHIKMNWGWGGLYDDIRFAPTSSWILPDWNFIYGNNITVDDYRCIIHGFEVN